MKPLNLVEIKLIAEELQDLIGARLQNVIANEFEYGFEVYHNRKTSWLYLTLDSQVPMLFELKEVGIFKKTTPLSLFIKAHCVGKSLTRIKFLNESGRVIFLQWGPDEHYCNFEIRLFPHGQNLIVYTPDKRMSWAKVKDLPLSTSQQFETVRNYDAIKEEWRANLVKVKNVIKVDKSSEILSKKIKNLEAVKMNLLDYDKNKWRELGEWLKQNQTLEVLEKWKSMIDDKLNLSKNIQNVFIKSKQFEAKKNGMHERIKVLENEIKGLQKREDQRLQLDSFEHGENLEKSQENLLFKFKIKGKRIPLKNHVVAYVGKSARDNLLLLRKSKAWDYWLHLKDYPGAHGFIKRNKNQNIPHSEIEIVAKAVAEKSKLTIGESFDVILTECRFVKPIKGDKIGRVTYKNEISFVFKM